MKLSITNWKYGKDWVYSITYDEALSDLAHFVIPVHERLGIPGHVEVVAGQIGQVRNCGASSYNGMRHMSAKELKNLISIGWGVGCHSWSHGMVMDNPDLELRQSKETIENAIGRAVTVYTAPGSNENLTPEVIEKIREYGYLAGMSITDDINRPDEDDLLWVNRVPLHERYWGPFDCAFDPFKRIQQAQRDNGWIVDYCHCPLEKPVHEYKDCSEAHHRERLETVVEAGRDNCWFANPDDVVDYRYMRRHTHIEADTEKDGRFVVHIQSLPEQVVCRELTFCLEKIAKPEITVDGKVVPLESTGEIFYFTTPAHDGMVIEVLR